MAIKATLKRLTVTLLTLLLSSVLLAVSTGFVSVQAADNTTGGSDTERITLSPAVSTPKLDAGATQNGTLTIINDGDTAYTFVLYARPFSVSGEQYDPNYTEVNDRTEAYQWVQFKQTHYSLKPGERVKAPYSVKVPQNAASGGHYAVLFAETQPPANDGSSVARKKRVGSLLYMTVNGPLTQAGSVESWSTSLWQKSRPLEAYVRVKNSGNVHFQANLAVSYKNILGKEMHHIDQQMLILPGTTRKVPVSWSDGPAIGIFKVSGSVNYLDKTDTLQTKYIVLLPLWVLWVITGLIVILAGWSVLRKRKKSHVKDKRSTRRKK